jgi:hypothetical protein
MSTSPEQRKNNIRLGLILASVAVAFLVGFVAKFVFYGR